MRSYFIAATIIGLALGNVLGYAGTRHLQEPPLNKLQQAAPVVFDWEGIWKVTGAERDGKYAYTGTVTIWRLPSGTYAVNWQIGSKGVPMYGTGRVVDGKLCVGWVMGDARGLTVYEATEAGAIGFWAALPGQGTVERETLVWLGELEP